MAKKKIMVELTGEQQKVLDKYPKVTLSISEFEALPEYSMTDPTQTGSMGVKKWRRRTPLDAESSEAIWFMGEIEGPMTTFYHIIT